MASIRARADTGMLFVDFRAGGVRCREQTALEDTPANRKKLKQLLARMELEMANGTFVYRNYFPQSKLVSQFADRGGNPANPPAALVQLAAAVKSIGQEAPPPAAPVVPAITPVFKAFAEVWFDENQVRWRKSYRTTIRDILDKHVIPEFGEKEVGVILKAEILKFRSELAKVPGRKNKDGLSASRINYIMLTVRQILTEAADRFNFTTPFRNIKALRIQKTDVQPFSLAEVQKILETVRPDYHNYLTVRFFTGMRTGEIDGLKWKYVDFENRQILVRETIVAGEEEYVDFHIERSHV